MTPWAVLGANPDRSDRFSTITRFIFLALKNVYVPYRENDQNDQAQPGHTQSGPKRLQEQNGMQDAISSSTSPVATFRCRAGDRLTATVGDTDWHAYAMPLEPTLVEGPSSLEEWLHDEARIAHSLKNQWACPARLLKMSVASTVAMRRALWDQAQAVARLAEWRGPDATRGVHVLYFPHGPSAVVVPAFLLCQRDEPHCLLLTTVPIPAEWRRERESAPFRAQKAVGQ